MTDDPDNKDRAARINRLSDLYLEICLGEIVEPASRAVLAGIVADMLHWCDFNDEEFQLIFDDAIKHHAQEQEFIDESLLDQHTRESDSRG